MALDPFAQAGAVVAPTADALVLGCRGQRGEQVDGAHQQPAEPDAFALPLGANPVHAVVPVAGADQRQTVFAGKLQALVDTQSAMFEQ